MNPQPLTAELLDELSGFEQSILLSEFRQHRYLLECNKAIRVDPAEGYMCKAIVYALSNDFDKMYENFQIAMKLNSSDDLINTNFIASMVNFGRFGEIEEFLSHQESIDDPIRAHALLRVLTSTLELEALKEINNDYACKIERTIGRLNLNIEEVKQYIALFNNLMYQKKIRFGLVPSISWVVEDGDLLVYYDFVGTASDSLKIMDEFSQLTIELGLRHISRKLTIILLPLHSC